MYIKQTLLYINIYIHILSSECLWIASELPVWGTSSTTCSGASRQCASSRQGQRIWCCYRQRLQRPAYPHNICVYTYIYRERQRDRDIHSSKTYHTAYKRLVRIVFYRIFEKLLIGLDPGRFGTTERIIYVVSCDCFLILLCVLFKESVYI